MAERISSEPWSPEVTLQAEDRCHRPGQTKEVHVHYILSGLTVDMQMHDLIMAKWAAQRAVQDREAQDTTVAAILDAAAKAVLTDLQLPADATPEQRAGAEQATKALKAELTSRLIFGCLPVNTRRKTKPGSGHKVAAVIVISPPLDAKPQANAPIAPGITTPGQIVQMAFFQPTIRLLVRFPPPTKL